MKTFFKYEYGYINVDAENLYLTNTGNWSETRGMAEKSDNRLNDTMRRARIITFFVIALVGLGIVFIGSIINFSFSVLNLILLIAPPIAAFKIYGYLQHDFGPQYRIPLAKLVSAEINETAVTLKFLTRGNKNASETLKNVEAKGIDFFNTINQAHAITE